ncbi:MAG: transposase family protein [Acidobacteria bacterium]|nr:transposase family protein [Acidobacteriota bacterium]
MSTPAELTRDSLAEAVFRRDDGMVHISKGYLKLCQDLKVTPSMGVMGSGAENSPVESFNGTRRRHSAIGNISPNAYETELSARISEAA